MLTDFLFGRVSFTALVFSLVVLIVAITVHEFSHALTANALGDPTARLRGRLTLNPSSHLDQWGTLMMLLFGFGWGKPVPVNSVQIRHGRLGVGLVSLAGPVSNLLLAIVFGLLLRFDILPSGRLIVPFALVFINLNVGLAIFNLLPFGPLDGYKILLGLLPARYAYQLSRLNSGASMLWVFVIAIFIFTPIYSFALNLFYAVVVGKYL